MRPFRSRLTVGMEKQKCRARDTFPSVPYSIQPPRRAVLDQLEHTVFRRPDPPAGDLGGRLADSLRVIPPGRPVHQPRVQDLGHQVALTAVHE